MKLGLKLIALSFIVLACAAVRADPIGGTSNTNCFNNSCQGSTYTLSYLNTPIASDATSNTYRIFYSIDTSTYTGGGSYVDNVAIKVSSDYVSFSLFDAPGGVASWQPYQTGVTANGCSGPGSGWMCADGLSNGGKGVAVGGLLQWVFDVKISNSSSLLLDVPTAADCTTCSSIKTRYVDANDVKVGSLVSESITLQVPEPKTLALVGLGMVIIGLGRKRLSAIRLKSRSK